MHTIKSTMATSLFNDLCHTLDTYERDSKNKKSNSLYKMLVKIYNEWESITDKEGLNGN